MTDNNSLVFLVDDDPSALRAVRRLLVGAGFDVDGYSDPEEFLLRHDREMPGCLLLDLAMPRLDGLRVQEALRASGCDRPVIFLTGHADVPATVQAMKAGANDFLTKPVSRDILVGAVQAALERDRRERQLRAEMRAIRNRLGTLTPREHEVFMHVVTGRLNKQIAGDLGIAEKTIKVHRARVMEKMGTRSLAELVRTADRLAIG